MDIKQYTVPRTASILDVLSKLDNQSSNMAMTVFVEDDNSRIIGTITDGDIRRSVLKTGILDTPITDIMHKDFKYLTVSDIDVVAVRLLREKNIKIVPLLDSDGRIVEVINLGLNKTYLPIDAVLMAGGKGERLRPMTLETPKPLLKVGDKPIIDYNVENLVRNGVKNISVTVNYLKEQIEDHFERPLSNGVKVNCVREPKYLGTMGSIKFIKEWHNDTVLVMNSDLFTNIDLEDFFVHFKEHDADMSVAAVPYSVNIPFGIFEIENQREITGVREKPSFHYYANAGVYLIKRELLDMIPDEEFFNATDLIEKLIESNKKVIRFPISGYWIDIGNPDDFKKVQDFAKHINKG